MNVVSFQALIPLNKEVEQMKWVKMSGENDPKKQLRLANDVLINIKTKPEESNRYLPLKHAAIKTFCLRQHSV